LDKSDEYRARAIDCLRLAQVTGQADNKAILREMARAWVKLAEYARERERQEVDAQWPTNLPCLEWSRLSLS